MTSTVRCYKNTKFNAVNLPDSPELLETMSYTDYTGFDLVSVVDLDGIKIRVGDSMDYKIGDVDYCSINEPSTTVRFYYVVNGYTPLSEGIVYLHLVPDYLTTLGGVTRLHYLDGITERYNPETDELFEFTQNDELMTPAEPLQLETRWFNDYESGSKTYLESTIDLIALGAQFNTEGEFTGAGMKFTDPTATVTSEKTVIYDSEGAKTGTQITERDAESTIVPYTSGVSTVTTYHGITGDVPAPCTCLYDAQASNVRRAVGAVRALQAESAILTQVRYPAAMDVRETGTGEITDVYDSYMTVSTDLAFDKYGTGRNKMLNCGQYNAIGMVTVAGEKIEAYPEQLYSGDATVAYIATSDPRPDGKPYYRFSTYMGKKFEGISDLMIGSVAGLQWETAPLVYTTPSGSYLDKINYQANAATAQINYGSTQTGIENAMYYNTERNNNSVLGNIISSVSSLVGNIKTGSTPDAGLYSMYNAQSSYEEGIKSNQNSLLKNELEYSVARQRELANYALSQSVVVPQVAVPFNANYLRDFAGNGVLIYRYSYSKNDAERIDRLLTIYGYKITAALETSMFTSRKYFNYVRAQGVSIDSSYIGDGPFNNRHIRDGAALQLSVGARFWHVAPSNSYMYQGSSNPVK